MNLQHVYLIQATTGEYADERSWVVAAYTNEEEAEQHRTLANKAMIPLKRMYWGNRTELHMLLKNFPYDDNPRMDFNGVYYEVLKVPLVNHVDEYQEVKDFQR